MDYPNIDRDILNLAANTEGKIYKTILFYPIILQRRIHLNDLLKAKLTCGDRHLLAIFYHKLQ